MCYKKLLENIDASLISAIRKQTASSAYHKYKISWFGFEM